jgi:putative transposase
MKKRYSEEQIIKAIKQHEAGAKVDDICREMGESVFTFSRIRSRVQERLSWHVRSLISS